jgi:hypothetical protein
VPFSGVRARKIKKKIRQKIKERLEQNLKSLKLLIQKAIGHFPQRQIVHLKPLVLKLRERLNNPLNADASILNFVILQESYLDQLLKSTTALSFKTCSLWVPASGQLLKER